MATIGEMYLDGRGGSVAEYHMGLRKGLRLGQAFFNALSSRDRDRLVGTHLDPFYKESSKAIEDAVTFLLDTE